MNVIAVETNTSAVRITTSTRVALIEPSHPFLLGRARRTRAP